MAQEELALTSEVVAGWQEKYPDVHVTTTTMRSHPVDALVDASEHASLLILGGRRRGPVGGALLGSVGHNVLHDADCPVAVVRAIRQPIPPPIRRLLPSTADSRRT